MGRKKRVPIPRGQSFYPLDYNFVFHKYDGKVQCSYCGVFENYDTITRDHVVPKSRGGSITVPSCYSCNELKKDSMPIEWAIESTLNGVAFGAKPCSKKIMYDM